jgi:argininosuccinate synthase
VLENPGEPAPEFVHMRTISPEDAPDKAEIIKSASRRGDAVSINGEAMSPATLLTALNAYGKKHGIGRLDLLENRFVGMKSRGIYETPGGTILLVAHRGIEQATLDRGAAHLKDELMPKYAELIYNGFWWSPEREMLQAAIDHSQRWVTGEVTIKLYKGTAYLIGRTSPYSLYSEKIVTFEDDHGAYDQKDAEGFIKLERPAPAPDGRPRPEVREELSFSFSPLPLPLSLRERDGPATSLPSAPSACASSGAPPPCRQSAFRRACSGVASVPSSRSARRP